MPMQVIFHDPKLEELYREGKSKRFHPDIIRSYIKWINFFIKASDIRDAYAIGGLHCEKLNGDRDGQQSVRLNKARRLIFTVNQIKEIQVVGIIEINNHYQ